MDTHAGILTLKALAVLGLALLNGFLWRRSSRW